MSGKRRKREGKEKEKMRKRGKRAKELGNGRKVSRFQAGNEKCKMNSEK